MISPLYDVYSATVICSFKPTSLQHYRLEFLSIYVLPYYNGSQSLAFPYRPKFFRFLYNSYRFIAFIKPPSMKISCSKAAEGGTQFNQSKPRQTSQSTFWLCAPLKPIVSEGDLILTVHGSYRSTCISYRPRSHCEDDLSQRCLPTPTTVTAGEEVDLGISSSPGPTEVLSRGVTVPGFSLIPCATDARALAPGSDLGAIEDRPLAPGFAPSPCQATLLVCDPSPCPTEAPSLVGAPSQGPREDTVLVLAPSLGPSDATVLVHGRRPGPHEAAVLVCAPISGPYPWF